MSVPAVPLSRMVPAHCLPLFAACRDAGGRALLVGGTVRDALLGRPGKDLDVEVHSLPFERLLSVLRRFGHVNEVGKSFHVLKLRMRDVELDVSVPRRDRREGVGHRGIAAEADPFLGVVEAARRRDLTINAIGYDPLQGVFEDPFGGRADLENRLLRAVDAHTFGEDPLRALRVAQFAGRFGFEVHPDLTRLCAEMPLHELPAERVRGEVEKLLLKARWPDTGWAFAQAAGLWQKVLPEWHGRVVALDPVAARSPREEPRRLALMLAAASGDEADALVVLDRLRVFRVSGYDVRTQVLFMCRYRTFNAEMDDTFCRCIAEEGEVELLALLRDDPALQARAIRLGVLQRPLPPLLTGRDLVAAGVAPGPRMGEILARVRVAQLRGQISTPDEARAWLRAGGPDASALPLPG